jgi:hypothetical protein
MEITVGHQGCRREETGAPSGTRGSSAVGRQRPTRSTLGHGVSRAVRARSGLGDLVSRRLRVPSIARIAHLSLGAIGTDGLVSLSGVGGALALVLCFGPLGWTLWGVARNAARVARTTLRPTPAG